MDIDIKQQIKELLLKENISMTDLVERLNNCKPTEENKTTLASLNNKLTRGSIKYSEILEIFDALDYDVVLQKKLKADVQSHKGEFFTPKSILGAVAGFTFGGVGGSIVGGVLGNTIDSKTKSGTITGSKNININLEQMQFRFKLEEQFEDILEVVIDYIIENSNLENLPDKIKSELKSYQNSDSPIGFRFQIAYRGLYIIVAQQIGNKELLDYLSGVRNIYASGGVMNLENDVLREFVEKADFLINTVLKKTRY